MLFPVVKVVVTISAFVLIGSQLSRQGLSFDINSSFLRENGIFLAGAMLLFPVNWMLEIYKWKILVDPFKPISYYSATSSVLAGLALNWIIPFTLGDFITRIGNLENPRKAVRALITNRLTSLLITVNMGVFGLLLFFKPDFALDHLREIAVAAGGMLLLTAIVLRSFANNAVMVLALSFLRYCVFSCQFFLLLYPFLHDLAPAIIAGGIFWTFLVKSILPSILGAIGIREASALVYFGLWSVSPEKILIPSVLLWIINIVLPSVIGISFFWKYRLKIA